MALGMTNASGDLAEKAQEAIDTATEAKEKAEEALEAANKAKENASKGSSLTGVQLPAVTNITIESKGLTIQVSWTDPNNVIYNGATLATWGGTLVVIKAGSEPANPTDGTVIVDSTELNAYSSTPFIYSEGIEEGIEYYVRIFPYTTAKTYTYTTSVTVTPNIVRSIITITPPSPTITLSTGALTTSIPYSTTGNGVVTATSSDPNVAKVEVDPENGLIIIIAVGNGSFTITINQGDGTELAAAEPVTIEGETRLYPDKLEEATVDEIQTAIDRGEAHTVWSPGDRIGIKLEGTVGAQTFNGTYYATVLGFEHNKETESDNKYSIHFIFGNVAKTTTTGSGTSATTTTTYVDTAFCDTDAKYMAPASDAGYRLNSTSSNAGGWQESYARVTLCNQFLLAMPQAWQDAIATVHKYTDNVGGLNNPPENVTVTDDKVFLPAVFEISGKVGHYNAAERNFQQQYTYYNNGNAAVRYNQRDTSQPVVWWSRSPMDIDEEQFDVIDENGRDHSRYANYSCGFAPCFALVAKNESDSSIDDPTTGETTEPESGSGSSTTEPTEPETPETGE